MRVSRVVGPRSKGIYRVSVRHVTSPHTRLNAGEKLTSVTLITLLGKVFAWRTRDPCRASILRLAKPESQLCKPV